MLAASLSFSGGPGLFGMPPPASCKRKIYFDKKQAPPDEEWKHLGFVLQIPNERLRFDQVYKRARPNMARRHAQGFQGRHP